MERTGNIVTWTLLSLSWLLLFSCASGSRTETNNGSNEDTEFFSLIEKAQSEGDEPDSTDRVKLAKDAFINGSTLQQQGKYAEAILEFQDALQYDTSAVIYSSIAYNFYLLNKFEKSQEYVLQALELNPNLTSAIELLGRIYLVRMKSDEALLTWERLVRLEPSLENKAMLANVYEVNNELDKALAIYEELAASGDEPTILMRLASLYNKKKMIDKYEQVLEKLYKYAPVKDRYAELLIEQYAETRKYDKIMDLVDMLETDIKEDRLVSVYRFVGICLNSDTTGTADRYILDLLNRFDNRFYLDPDITKMGGYLSVKLDDSVKAYRFFNRYLNLTDTLINPVLEVGSVYLGKKWFQPAMELLEKYRHSFPGSSMIELYISYVYDETGNSGKALEVLYNALASDSLNFDLWAQAGIINDNTGNFEKAREAYEAALKIEPGSPLINNNYAYSLSVRGENLDRALEMVKIALKNEPNSPSYLDTYAWIQYKMGNMEFALEYLKKAVERGGGSSEIFDHLGEVYLKMGDNDKARDAWLKALEFEPDNKDIIEKLDGIIHNNIED